MQHERCRHIATIPCPLAARWHAGGFGAVRRRMGLGCRCTYIPMACGWVYLCAIVDWAGRRVLSHRVSISMDASFCVEALQEAFSKFGQPEIFHRDQGSQFTSEEFTEALKARGVAISMDGRGAWRDKDYVSYCTSFA